MGYSCSREKSISKLAYEKEKAGNLSEAIYDYHRALNINSKYGFANKRLGFIFSESQFSVIPAIYHLEVAREEDPLDLEINLKLIDLTLFVQDFEKYSQYYKQIQAGLKPENILEIETIYGCLAGKNTSKKMAEKLNTLEFSKEIALYYRSLALCYDTAGEKEKAEQVVKQYRKVEKIQ